MKRIILSGPPGVGKSTIGRAVAERLSITPLDLDEVIEARENASPGEIIRNRGEAAFRAAELAALEAEASSSAVLALGGGTLTQPAARRQARRLGPVIGLFAETEVLVERLSSGSGDRPLLAGGLKPLLDRRARTYRAVDRRVDTSASLEAVVERVVEAAGGLELIEATMGDVRSRILVGEQLEEACAGAVAALEPKRPILLVLDAGVPEDRRRGYAEALEGLGDLVTVELPGGEAVKTWSTLGELLERALAAGCGRQSVVVGVGGGATCDLAAMAASLLGRGAPVVLVPSTLLAQVDASVGGKTAVNLGGRNLIGTFHPASDVLIDVTLTRSQPEADYRSGMAEILKMGIITDPGLFDTLLAEGRATAATIARAVAHKARIVEADPKESGLRKVLNLGHTLAHGLEAASGFSLRHGEAVAMGTAAVARFSEERGWLDEPEKRRIVQGLASLGLPTSAPRDLLVDAVEHIKADKKGTADEIDLVCVRRVGKVTLERLPLHDAQDGFVRHGGDA